MAFLPIVFCIVLYRFVDYAASPLCLAERRSLSARQGGRAADAKLADGRNSREWLKSRPSALKLATSRRAAPWGGLAGASPGPTKGI